MNRPVSNVAEDNNEPEWAGGQIEQIDADSSGPDPAELLAMLRARPQMPRHVKHQRTLAVNRTDYVIRCRAQLDRLLAPAYANPAAARGRIEGRVDRGLEAKRIVRHLETQPQTFGDWLGGKSQDLYAYLPDRERLTEAILQLAGALDTARATAARDIPLDTPKARNR